MHSIRILLTILLFGSVFPVFVRGQNLDEMISSVNEGRDDTVTVNIIIDICDSLFRSNPDETLKYAKNALELARTLNFRKGEAMALKYFGMGYFVKGEYPRAIEQFQQSLEIFEEMNYKIGIANLLSNIGVVYNNEGDDVKSLEYHLRSLKISEEINDSIRVVTSLVNMGLIYSKKKATVDKAREHYLLALNISEKLGYMLGIGTLSTNLGELLYNNGDDEEALSYFQKALDAYKKTNSGVVPYTLIYIGKIYAKRGDFANAIKYQEEALKIARQSNSKLETGQSLIGLANIYLQKGDAKKALELFKESDKIATEIGALYESRETYEGMANASARLNDYVSAYRYQSLESGLKDSIFSETSQFQISQLRIQYETETMLKENEILKRDVKLREAKSRILIIILISLFMGFLSISIFLILLSRANSHKKKANEELNRINTELNTTLDLVNSQKMQIETAHEEITASINYARYIQASLLPKTDQMESLLYDHFIIYKPKEIVSGDFYWISQTGEKTIIVAADCTGHGVPGAFMSMLGITLLNEIINKDGITEPGIILDRLRKEVIDSLKQKGYRGEQKDGMDITLCSIDNENMTLQFAGAINPMYVVRESAHGNIGIVHKFDKAELILSEIKGDRMPIGLSDEMDNFASVEIRIEKGDTFYLFSDGFPDQFGAPAHKKFSYRQLREQLIMTSRNKMADQKVLLEDALHNWMGNNDQTDDIMMIGFRIS
jgi:serine phosphatase RsbU (regulator of sigma subunit)/tetratricopeptide (TPR) repeat protein